MPRGKVIDTDYLREHYPTATDVYEFLDGYEKQFGHRPSKAAVYMKAQRLGIKKAPVAGRHKRAEREVKWSREPEMLEWMLEHDHGQRVDSLSDEFRKRWGFGLTRGQINLFRATYDKQVRQDGTRRGGRKRVPVGTERVGKDGYITIKVRPEADKAMSKDNWMLKHVWVYEQTHGVVPDGHVVYFADGDRRNFDPDNLVAVPRKLIGVMNGMGIEWHDRETLEAVVKLAEMRCQRNYLIAAQKRTCPCCGAEFDNLRRMRERGSIRSTICYECGRAGRKPPTGKGKRTRFDHDEIRRLHAMGWRNEEIADMLGCTPSTVSVAIHELEKKEDK